VAAQSVVTEKTSHVLSSSASASSSSQQQQVTKGQKMMSKKMKQQLASTFEMPNEPLSPNEPLIALEALEIEDLVLLTSRLREDAQTKINTHDDDDNDKMSVLTVETDAYVLRPFSFSRVLARLSSSRFM
jgi:hypothetical protein